MFRTTTVLVDGRTYSYGCADSKHVTLSPRFGDAPRPKSYSDFQVLPICNNAYSYSSGSSEHKCKINKSLSDYNRQTSCYGYHTAMNKQSQQLARTANIL
jgi:hypothetical protein